MARCVASGCRRATHLPLPPLGRRGLRPGAGGRAAHESADAYSCSGSASLPAVAQRRGLDEGSRRGREGNAGGAGVHRECHRRPQARRTASPHELPSVTGEAAPAARRTAVPGTMSAAIAGAGKVHIVTDVLDLDASLCRRRADPRGHAAVSAAQERSDDAGAAVQHGFAGDAVPVPVGPDDAARRAAANRITRRAFSERRDGISAWPRADDSLEVPLTWSDGAGLSVTKTFVLHRGSYAVDLRYHVENAGAEPVKLASYAQLLRHSPGNKRSMWDPDTYSFRGPAYLRRREIPEAEHRGRGRREAFAARHERLDRGAAAPFRRGDRAGGRQDLPVRTARQGHGLPAARGRSGRGRAGRRQPGVRRDAVRRAEAAGPAGGHRARAPAAPPTTAS